MIRTFRAALGVAALFPASSISAAQQTPEVPIVHVGDAAMNGRAIAPYDNVWLVRQLRNDGHIAELGLSTDHVRFISVGGKRYLSRIETEADVISLAGQPPTSALSSTFNIFDPVTMQPLYGEARSSDGGSMIRHFQGRNVETQMRETGAAPEMTASVTTAESVFDAHGGMTGLLLRALPLRIGYRAKIPGVGDTDLDYTEIDVVRAEVIKGRSGRIRTFVIDIGPHPARSTYWISERPPYVIKAVVRDSKGYTSWDMIN